VSAPENWAGGPVPATSGRATCVLEHNPSPLTLEGTNTWLLAAPGSRDVVVVDPGEDDPAHRAAITAALAGRRVALVVATHHHHDHVGGLEPFLAAHPAGVVRVPGEHHVAGLDLRVVATPGHTDDSVSVLAGPELLTGDTLLGRGSTLVTDVGAYLDSLRTLLALEFTTVLPGHGPPCGRAALRTQLDHRLARLEEVRAALAAGATTAEEIVRIVHPDLPAGLGPAATQSISAQLAYLQRPA
jgi:glyoxylase-like metal-dependent hydrolase (beta-lactamase superfamily II)